MREFSFTIDEKILQRGLRPDWRLTNNQAYLDECINLKPSEAGLVPYEYLVDPFGAAKYEADAIEWDWPFPQLLAGRSNVVLATSGRIFQVDTSDWTLSRLPTYTVGDEGTAINLESGRSWNYVDLGKSWFMCNGENSVLYLNKSGMVGGTDKVLVSRSVCPECACQFKGRIILGGFNASHNFLSTLADFFGGLADTTITSLNKDIVLGENFIYYSSIGGGDLFTLFDLSYAQYGYLRKSHGTAADEPFDTTKTFIMSLLKRNDFGPMPLSTRGLIRALIPTQNGIMAYSDKGVSFLTPFANNLGSGFGETVVLKDIGIANTGAAAGNESIQGFVDTHGEFWTYTEQSGFKKLGYKEYLEPLLGGEIKVSYDVYRNEFYISTNSKTYILNNWGLYETNQHVTSTIYEDGNVLGVAYDLDSVDKTAYLTLGGFDYRIPGIKSVTGLGINGTINTNGYAGVKYRYDRKATKTMSSWRLLNTEGFAKVAESGLEIAPRFKFDDFREVIINSLTVDIQNADKRYQRGLKIGGFGAIAGNS